VRSRNRIKEADYLNIDALTDIIANTVGIMIIIILLTIISAQGTFFKKRLPILRPTAKDSVIFICQNNRIIRYDSDGLMKLFLQPLDLADVQDKAWLIETLNNRCVNNGAFEITGTFHFEESELYYDT